MEADLSMAQVKRIVADLRTPRPLIYWTDFLLSVILADACFYGAWAGALLSLQQGFCFIVSGLSFYRAAVFTHELVHLPHEQMGFPFLVFWNLLFGIPFLMPSFTYWTHLDHHRATHLARPWTASICRSPTVHLLACCVTWQPISWSRCWRSFVFPC